MADGLSGGRHAGLVERLALRGARGTVLDHLVFLSSERPVNAWGWHPVSEPSRGRVLIAGVSTRALAVSAAKAGYAVTAMDAFGDQDLRLAAKVVVAPTRPGRTFNALETAIEPEDSG